MDVVSVFLAVVAFPWAAHGGKTTAPKVPALVVFGDSIMDPGNNNAIKTIVKCNFPPYGNNFYGRKPTGRFCNGKIPTDLIASRLGIKELLPAYVGARLSPYDILTGVSFASGGAGYDPLTSKIASVISLEQQIDLFKEYKEKLRSIAGDTAAAHIVSKALYVACAGSDDVANTYFGTPIRQAEYDSDSYTDLVLNSASAFVQELISLGARKIAVTGIPPIGCVPSQRTLGGGLKRDCAVAQNAMAELFNSKLKDALPRLSATFPGTTLIYFDVYTPLLDLMLHPNKYGFQTSTQGCCGTGKLEVSVLCNSLTSAICANVSNYVFWDSYHPTEKAYQVLVNSLYDNNADRLLQD
ncbi:GDSL esterase/lipase EXL3-like isoform X2 [Iris pallida]|uniref:GDSL esterase/lipase EXL3-like isoform X2 n=1 Tax=Iris pallida TaxID=29817 RepID=A0AAX6IFV9_IRIPA|nr:GDSL esterase/lipase EXL3-like isoform X2 [Iris pallida]